MNLRARLLTTLLAVAMLVLPASAASITLSPTRIEPGEPVMVAVTGLPDGARFTLLAEGVYPVPGDQPLLFQLNSFRMPFSLERGEITTSAGNARWVKFEARLGNTTAALETSPKNGSFSHTEAKNIRAGTYEFIRLSALPVDPGEPVTTRIAFTGTKAGPDDATITFVPEGITAGDLHVVVMVDDERELDENLAIGGGNLTVSADGVAALSGQGIAGARFVAEDPAGVPEGWKALTRSYRLVTEADLPPGTSLVMLVPADSDPERYTLFVASYRDGTWTLLPSRIFEGSSGREVVADIPGPGTFALMGIEDTVPETPAPTKSAIAPATVLSAALLVFLITRGRKR